MKPTNWKNGLQRLYFTIAGIWYCFLAFVSLHELSGGGFGIEELFIVLLLIAVPVAIYFVSIWVWQGFYEAKD